MRTFITYAILCLDLVNLAAFLVCIPISILMIWISKSPVVLYFTQFLVGQATIWFTCLLFAIMHEPVHLWTFIIPWFLALIIPYPGRHIVAQSIGIIVAILSFVIFPP